LSANPPLQLPAGITPEAEAARYALLRRLAPSMRHHLVVNLQPIGMIYEVMERRLRAPTPDLAHVRDSAGKINGFAKAALSSCLDVVSWLSPDDAVAVTVEEAVRECAALLATSLSFRGYALRNHVMPLQGSVRRSAIRNLLSGAMIHCTDHARAPAELELTCRTEGATALVSVQVRENAGEQAFSAEPNYRKISWQDLEALAVAEGVLLARDAGRVDLRLPWTTTA
jgi:C4-dicarboxylate-specific signal transduction histidine kinase